MLPLWLRALVQEIQLDAKVKLLDCPGVIFDDETRPNSSSLLLRNVVRVESMDEPEVRARWLGVEAGLCACA